MSDLNPCVDCGRMFGVAGVHHCAGMLVQQMTDTLRTRIAAVLQSADGRMALEDEMPVGVYYASLADAVIRELKADGWTLAPPDVAVFTGTYVGDGRGSYADNFCRGGCDCSCCYGMADEPCHCRDAICNCGGDRAAHGQKPLEDK